MKQKLAKAKQWAKEHKEEIIGGVVVLTVGTVAGVYIHKLGNKPMKIDGMEDYKLFEEFCNVVDEVRDGSKGYIPVTADEFKAMTNGLECLRDPNGTLMKVKGLIAFGDEITEP